MGFTEALSKGAVGCREIESAYLAAQASFRLEGCSFFCFDDDPISFAAEMRHKARSTFRSRKWKINVGKRGREKGPVAALKRHESLNNILVVDAIETQAEVALGFQKRRKPIETIQRHGRGKLFYTMTGNDMEIRRRVFNINTVSNVSATKGKCGLLSVWDALDNPYLVSDGLLEKAEFPAEKTEFTGRFEFVAHSLGTVISDEVFHGCDYEPLSKYPPAEPGALNCAGQMGLNTNFTYRLRLAALHPVECASIISHSLRPFRLLEHLAL